MPAGCQHCLSAGIIPGSSLCLSHIPSISLVKSKGCFTEGGFVTLPNQGSRLRGKWVVSEQALRFLSPVLAGRCCSVCQGCSSPGTTISASCSWPTLIQAHWKSYPLTRSSPCSGFPRVPATAGYS